MLYTSTVNVSQLMYRADDYDITEGHAHSCYTIFIFVRWLSLLMLTVVYCSVLPVIDPELKSDTFKIKTYSESKLGKEGQHASTPESIPHPEMDGSSSKSPQSGQITAIYKN